MEELWEVGVAMLNEFKSSSLKRVSGGIVEFIRVICLDKTRSHSDPSLSTVFWRVLVMSSSCCL